MSHSIPVTTAQMAAQMAYMPASSTGAVPRTGPPQAYAMPAITSPRPGPSAAPPPSTTGSSSSHPVPSSSRPLNYSASALASSSGWGTAGGWASQGYPQQTGSHYWEASGASPAPGLLGPAPTPMPLASVGLPTMPWPSAESGVTSHHSTYVPSYLPSSGWEGYGSTTHAEWSPVTYAATSGPQAVPEVVPSAPVSQRGGHPSAVLPSSVAPVTSRRPTLAAAAASYRESPREGGPSGSSAVSTSQTSQVSVNSAEGGQVVPSGVTITPGLATSQVSVDSAEGQVVPSSITITPGPLVEPISPAEETTEGDVGVAVDAGATSRVTRSSGGPDEDSQAMLPPRLIQETHTAKWRELNSELLQHLGQTYSGVTKQWLNKGATVIPVPASRPQDYSSRLLPLSSVEVLQGNDLVLEPVINSIKVAWGNFMREQMKREKETIYRRALLDLRTLREQGKATAYHHLLYAHIWEGLGTEFTRLKSRSDLMALSVGELEQRRVFAFSEFLPHQDGILRVLKVKGPEGEVVECMNDDLDCVVEKRYKKKRR